jgi:hypothetical protein
MQNTAVVVLGAAVELARELWTGPQSSRQLVSVDGRRLDASRTDTGLLRADAISLSGRRGPVPMTVRGGFSKADPWTTRHIRPGDPIAVLLERERGRASGAGAGLVLPARYGEAFELTVPAGDYRLTAYALDRYGVSLSEDRSVRALGARRVSASRPPPGREIIALHQRPGLQGVEYSQRSWDPSMRIDLAPSRERIRVRSRPERPAVSAAIGRGPLSPRRCSAGVNDGRCLRVQVAGHNLCERHLRDAVRYRSVAHMASGAPVVVRCDHEKSNGRRCGREAVALASGPPVRAYCAKHVKSVGARDLVRHCTFEKSSGRRCGRDAVVVRLEHDYAAYCAKHLERAEAEPSQCRARTAAGARCRNPVASSHGELCASHNDMTGKVYHYATDELWYE